MTSLPDDFNKRLQAGDDEVASWIFQQFAQRLARLAAVNIGSKLRQRVDPEDILQSALRTFFRRAGQGDFKIDQSGDLWSLLARIVVMKSRYHARIKRDFVISGQKNKGIRSRSWRKSRSVSRRLMTCFS